MEKKDLLEGLTPVQVEKMKKCKHQVDLLALAKQEGVELTDEQLAAVSGGGCFDNNANTSITCPLCGRNGDDIMCKIDLSKHTVVATCKICNYTFEIEQ